MPPAENGACPPAWRSVSVKRMKSSYGACLRVLKAALCFQLLWLHFPAAVARPASVILLRHAEKPAGESDVHLSERGQLRARALPGLFATNAVLLSYGRPAALFAPSFTKKGHAVRPYETLRPLAEHLNLPIQMPYRTQDYADLARQILEDPTLNDKTVVICWVHDDLPDLAKAFGVKPKPPHWRETIYDRIWVITFRGDQANLVILPEHLLPGDGWIGGPHCVDTVSSKD